MQAKYQVKIRSARQFTSSQNAVLASEEKTAG